MATNIELIKLRMAEGVWHGALTNLGQNNWQPNIEVTHLDAPLDGIEVEEDSTEGHWNVRIPIPADKIADGVQTFVISDKNDDAVLGSFSIVAGDALAEDIRAEVSLLRAELDMLKKAFRRHCVETM